MANHYVSPTGTATWGEDTAESPASLATAVANAAAGDVIYVKTGTPYVLTAQLTIAGDGTAINPIIWEPFEVAAGDWDGAPGAAVFSYDSTFDAVRCNGEFHHFRGIRTSGNRSNHNRGWRIVGDGSTVYRCVAEKTGSTGFLLAGAHTRAVQCEVRQIGDAGGAFGFKLQGYRATCIGCYADDVIGKGFGSSTSSGYDLGIYYCISTNVRAGTTPSMDGQGFVFESADGTDDVWGGTAIGTRTALMFHCVAHDCAVGFSVGDGATTTNQSQPLMLVNCIAAECTLGVGNASQEITALLVVGMGLYGNTTDYESAKFSTTRLVADTSFSVSPFEDAAAGDFRLAESAVGWPTQFVVGGALSSWDSEPQLGAAFGATGGLTVGGGRTIGIGV